MPNASNKHYILRYRGGGRIPKAEAQRVSELPGVGVLDDSPRMLLIESAHPVERLQPELPDWSISEEQSVPLPQPPKPKILKHPDA